MTFEVFGELEAALKAQADQRGLSTDRVARQLLEEAWTPGVGREGNASGEEKARAFIHWAKSHRDTPPLSDEAVSRASMYPDRR
jgi:hypothetical protein